MEEGLPRAIFVNKLDRERADFQGTLDQLVSSFGNQVAPLRAPDRQEHEFGGIADLLHEKADLYPSGPKAEESEWPDDIHAMADPAREKLIEAVAESDDALIEEYLEQRHASRGAHRDAARRRGSPRARLAPVIVRVGREGDRHRPAARLHRRGVPLTARPRPDHGGREGRRGGGRVSATRAGPPPRSCSRPSSDPFVGHITMFRVFSGHGAARLERSSTPRRAPRSGSASCSRSGQGARDRRRRSAGDIGAVAKLQHAHTGDTWSTKDDPVQLPSRQPARAAARLRDRAGDQGRGGQARRPGSRASGRRIPRSASSASRRPTRP